PLQRTPADTPDPSRSNHRIACDCLIIQHQAKSGSLWERDLTVMGLKPFGQKSFEVVDVLLENEVLHSHTVARRRGQVDVQVGMPVRRSWYVERCCRMRHLEPLADAANDTGVRLENRRGASFKQLAEVPTRLMDLAGSYGYVDLAGEIGMAGDVVRRERFF